MRETPVEALDIESLRMVVGADRLAEVQVALGGMRSTLAGGRLWNVNSTAAGGGVAEMLARVLGYQRAAGIDARWMVITGDERFFAITKRLHHALHGMPGDGGSLGPAQHRHYRDVVAANAETFVGLVRSGDVAVLHDPQVAPLAAPLHAAGVATIWRCHVGADHTNEHTDRAWAFLRPHVEAADASVFSRREYVPAWMAGQVHVAPPTIDPLSAKNQALGGDEVTGILARIGLIACDGTEPAVHGSRVLSKVHRRARIVRTGPAPHSAAPLIVQVSRWDPLKDPAGVMEAFCRLDLERYGCHLALVGPDVTEVADDPEGQAVLQHCTSVWEALPAAQRARIHLVSLPMADTEENAWMVNAIQRHAAVVVQKSLAEGFGLTVTEAMWKAKPVVASAVGGIQDQIDDGTHGYLLPDPTDPDALAGTLKRILDAPHDAAAIARRARARVQREFLDDRQLTDWAALVDPLVGGEQAA